MRRPKFVTTAFEHDVTKESINSAIDNAVFHDDDFEPGSDPVKELYLGFDVHGNMIEVMANYDELRKQLIVFHAMKARTKYLNLLSKLNQGRP